jgi:hypothetical protein
MKKMVPVFGMCLVLSGCALSTGPSYRVQTKSPTGITFLVDPALRSLPQARQVAEEHCAQYGRTAVQASVGKLRGGQAPVTFACR